LPVALNYLFFLWVLGALFVLCCWWA